MAAKRVEVPVPFEQRLLDQVFAGDLGRQLGVQLAVGKEEQTWAERVEELINCRTGRLFGNRHR